jgi:neutral trehalase
LKQQMTPIILVSLDVFASWLKATQPLTTIRITELIPNEINDKYTKFQQQSEIHFDEGLNDRVMWKGLKY